VTVSVSWRSLRPGWLRPSALAALVAVHGAIFYTAGTPPTPSSPLEAVAIPVIALGDDAQEQTAQEAIAEPRPPAAQAVPQPEPVPPPPPPVAAEAPPSPVAPPKPRSEPTKPPRGDPRPPRPVQRKARAPTNRPPQEARQAVHQGVTSGAEAGGVSRAEFGALVIAELNRRKFFPAAARAAQASGSVGVAFTIGPAGRVVSQSIVRSSGNAALDDAARTILSALRTPPPPGGAFSASSSIRFELD